MKSGSVCAPAPAYRGPPRTATPNLASAQPPPPFVPSSRRREAQTYRGTDREGLSRKPQPSDRAASPRARPWRSVTPPLGLYLLSCASALSRAGRERCSMYRTYCSRGLRARTPSAPSAQGRCPARTRHPAPIPASRAAGRPRSSEGAPRRRRTEIGSEGRPSAAPPCSP